MKINYTELRQDWEKIIFAGISFIVSIIFVIFIINTFFSDNTRNETSLATQPHHSLFNENAFAFLAGINELDEDELPFSYSKSFHKPKIKRTPRVNADPKPIPKPIPKPQKNGHVIHYNGWVTLSDSGRKLAFIKVHDFRTGKLLKSDSVGIENEIFSYTVLDIGEENVIIKTPDGDEKEIPIHKNIKIINNE
jgi:hypothetical protein